MIEQFKGTAQKADKKTKEQFTALEQRAGELATKYQALFTKDASPKAKKAEEKASKTFDKTPKGKKKAGKEDKKIDQKRVVDFSKEIARCESFLDSHFAAVSKATQTKTHADQKALFASLPKTDNYLTILAELESRADKANTATQKKLSELRQRADVLNANLSAILKGKYEAVKADPKVTGAFNKAAKDAKTDKTKTKPLSDKKVKKLKNDASHVHPNKLTDVVAAIAKVKDAKGEKAISKAREELRTLWDALPQTVRTKITALNPTANTADEQALAVIEFYQRDLLGMIMLLIDKKDIKAVLELQGRSSSKVKEEVGTALKTLKKSKDKQIAEGAKRVLNSHFDGPALKEALKLIQKSYNEKLDATLKAVDQCVEAIVTVNKQPGTMPENMKSDLIVGAYHQFLDKTTLLWDSEKTTFNPREKLTVQEWLTSNVGVDSGAHTFLTNIAFKLCIADEKALTDGTKKADGKKDSKKADDKKKADSKKDSKKVDDKKKAGSKKDSKKADDKKKADSKKDSKKVDDKKKAGSKKDSKKADDKKKAGSKKDSKKADDKKKADSKKDSKKADDKKKAGGKKDSKKADDKKKAGSKKDSKKAGDKKRK